MRLKNKIGLTSLKRIAGSIFNLKLRYGIHLCVKLRNLDSDPSQGVMEDLQEVQNKLFRLLHNTRINDRIKTINIAHDLKMLSDN